MEVNTVFDYYSHTTSFETKAALCLITLFLLYLYVKDIGLPPGPISLPVFGYWPLLKADSTYIQMTRLAKKYGDVFSFRSAGKLYIHLGSIKSIREAHVTKSDCFQGRFSEYCLLSCLFDKGVSMANGERWKVLRKFFVMQLKEYGVNATKEKFTEIFEDVLYETVQELVNLKKCPVEITDIITEKCTIIIRKMLFNDQCISKDEINKVCEEFDGVFTYIGNRTFFLIGNIAKYLIFPFMPSFKRFKRTDSNVKAMVSEIFNKQKVAYKENDVSNIIGDFFRQRDNRRKSGDPSEKYFTDDALFVSLLQFLTDSTRTISLFIGVLIMSLADHPEEQEQVYEEILDVIGLNRLPTFEDRSRLPYTGAFMYEVMRLSDLFVLYPSMECSKETTLGGYRIPKGSVTVLNLYAAHRNPEIYPDPESFKPSRYLVKPGKPKPDLPIIFGVGKRTCLAEAYSMNQGFLFFATIVQNFRIAYPKGSSSVSNIFWTQKKLRVCAIPRKTE